MQLGDIPSGSSRVVYDFAFSAKTNHQVKATIIGSTSHVTLNPHTDRMIEHMTISRSPKNS